MVINILLVISIIINFIITRKNILMYKEMILIQKTHIKLLELENRNIEEILKDKNKNEDI